MEGHIVKVLRADFVTHNVKRFRVEKPSNYNYVPGQATDVSINRPGLENELRPFTFTSLPHADHLEFIIKIYKGRNGVTEKLGELQAGEEIILHDVFGTIHYAGEGLFIAGGAGITPFIAILRHLKTEDGVKGNSLLFANRTPADIIMKDELEQMLGTNFFNVLENPEGSRAIPGYITRELLREHIKPETRYCYVCGPDIFTATMIDHLLALGFDEQRIIREQ